MGVPNATHQAASDAVAGLGRWCSLHTAAGGTTGANETSGGGYGRQQTTWTPNGSGTNTGSTVNIPCAAGTYTEAGVWSASTSGTFDWSNTFVSGSVVVSGTGASIDLTPTIVC